jgi:hypothetical protein
MSHRYSPEEQHLFFDKLAIKEVLDLYWHGLGRHDVDDVTAAFTGNGRVGTARGEEEIRKSVEVTDGIRCITIIRGSQMITVDGDSATADSQALAFLVRSQSDEERLLLQGVRYIDDLVRTPSGWQIQRRGGRTNKNIVHDIEFELDVQVTPGKWRSFMGEW